MKTFSVLKLFIPLISFNLWHLSNIFPIFFILEVLKFDKSKYSNSWHSQNNANILLTFVVLKLLIPLIAFNLRQKENIKSILETLEVLKLDKSKYSNSLHPRNIEFILVTWDVSKDINSIVFNEEQSVNI